ncbi:MAG: hypothetical protein CL946_13585, partial [Ectothiorhodospiraceae bacterium]|nr:hypothetical protein [Ectothiorhodospiraceae bacterium]
MTKQILYTVFFTALLALLAVTSGNGQSFTDPHIREGDPLPQAPMPGNDGVQLGKVAAPLQIPESSKSVTIDGYIDEASEWSDAEQLDLPFTQFVGQQPKSKVWIKNDYCGLYIAFEMHFEHIPIHYPGYRGIIERGCMLNMWIDRDSDQVFDFDPTPDPVLSFPSLNNPTKAAFGHRSLPGWYWWNYIDGLRSHAPWMTAPVDITNSQVVRRFDYNNDVVYIEGYVDFRVAPIDLVPGSTFRMRLNGYADFSNSGTETLLINGCWPTQGPNWTYWFDPLPTGDRLETTSLANVPQPTDDYDVLSAELAPDPDYGAFAYESGEEILVSIEVEDVASLPMDIPFTANIYGPHPSNALHSTHSGIAKATVPAGKVSASIPFNGPEGFYNVELLVEDPNACGVELYQNSMYALGYAPGTTPCIVYPGDVNNDGIVNYGD